MAQAEAQFVYRLQAVGGFGGKSDQLNAQRLSREPESLQRDLVLPPGHAAGLAAATRTYLRPDARVRQRRSHRTDGPRAARLGAGEVH
jgi:hypothetical protein